ncbi:Spx/MgsR family RNA polymerase-binding regulatory protein [Myxococcus stipitatus]|uniref:Spx/MgsR family RNA polymerase-binding regulatory protein n=1 Tax=Myxococcus stipitatus TaxID=83455 RepID=UPI003144DC08
MSTDVLVLSYSGCSTCKKALKWLEAKGVAHTVRPIVDTPPTVAELEQWIPRSGVSVRKWLNTSGQSYRAMGKAKVDVASEAELRAWLAADGKLVKRPVVVTPTTVLVGFQPEAWERVFASRG